MVYLMPIRAVEGALGLHKSALYDRITRGLMPPPVRSGCKSVWPSNEVEQIVGASIVGMPDDEIRALVASMVAARKGALKRLAA